MSDVYVKKLTPVLVVKAIEPCLEFWEKRLGFARAAEVPHENTIGFVILVKDGIELMLQSVASVEADLGSTLVGQSAALFIEVADLDAVERSLSGYPLALARRTTFYGMHEIGAKEPGGHFVIFAQPNR
jgi:hypothetical protein